MTIFQYLIRSIKILILIIILFLLFKKLAVPLYLKYNHKNIQEVKINNWLGKVIYLPLIDSTLNISQYYPQNNIKLVSYINADCGLCIGDFDKWRPILKKIKSFSNTEIIFYVHSSDFMELLNNIERKNPFPIDLIVDKENLFFLINNLDSNKMFHTFLLDNNNKVLLIGNPTMNSDIQELYIKTIQKLTKNQ